MKTLHQRQRGSLLIVAMLLSAIIAIALTSYLQMATTAVQLSARASSANEAMNLTETGLEQAMSAINANTWSSPWATSGTDASATFSGFTYPQGATGSVKVYVQNCSSTNPLVVAQGTITPVRGAPIIKMVEISGIIQRSLFSKGLVGRNGVSFSGTNPSVDSWNSHFNADGTPRATPVGYSESVARDKGSIAAVNVTATDAVGNADIWGTASVGGSSAGNVTVGPQGRVGPYGTAAGVKNAAYIGTNFTANLPAINTPTPDVTNGVIAAKVPAVGDSPASDGKYYYVVSSITMAASQTLEIQNNAKVVLLLQAGQGTTALQMTGNAQILVDSGSHLDIYAAGDIKIGGNGIANANATYQSDSVQIWGTNTSATSPGQDIQISGNGSLACTCYAPNASISAKGGGHAGDVYGAFVGYSIAMTGGDAFHYDENLGAANNSGTFSPTKWRELVLATDRATYSAHF